MGHRIVLSMLKKYSLEELKFHAITFMQEQYEKLFEEQRHFMLFSAMFDKIEKESKDRV